ncbi:recombinase RecU [Erysipelothrix larvae]|uniref:Holliday junction resolvase RecU n=1 Tax=Erysipelothrix larvae TaxID=1514105 RepID=A0A0X8GZG7_9FIRM|nr:Holliday junction resolvase RecU [Erysipelothrix larvae]AMC93214.1 recombinase RecU [Erysipelothrix larvae]
MIQYPNGTRKNASRPQQANTSRRGMTLESDINQTNESYLIYNKAVIHKKPTPIQVVHVDYPARNKAKIVEAYYRHASTTDYNGIYKGKYIDFEAKETKNRTIFPLALLHQHQIDHLRSVLQHGAIAFLIIRFTSLNETYLVYAQDIFEYISTHKSKSLPLPWIREIGTMVEETYHAPCDYLPIIDQRLKENL